MNFHERVVSAVDVAMLVLISGMALIVLAGGLMAIFGAIGFIWDCLRGNTDAE